MVCIRGSVTQMPQYYIGPYVPLAECPRGIIAILTFMTMLYLPMQRGLFQLVVAIHSPPFYMDREGKKLSTTEWQLFQKVIFLKSLTLRISQPQEAIKGFVHDVSCIHLSKSFKVVPYVHVKSLISIPHSMHTPITAIKVSSYAFHYEMVVKATRPDYIM